MKYVGVKYNKNMEIAKICSGARNRLVIRVAATIIVHQLNNGCAHLWLNIYCNKRLRKRNIWKSSRFLPQPTSKKLNQQLLGYFAQELSSSAVAFCIRTQWPFSKWA